MPPRASLPFEATLQRHRRQFERMVEQAQHARRPLKRILLAAQCALFAVHHPCGILYSQALEALLQNDAVRDPVATETDPARVLHVLSTAYATGGHTRIVERWIGAAPVTETHDLVLLSQGDRPIPVSLQQRVAAKRGTVRSLTALSPLRKASALRLLAAPYGMIVLHTHMHDPVPLLAFSAEGFQPPIALFNHADHLFWFGATIADVVVNFRATTLPLDRQARGVATQSVVPLPVEAPTPISAKAREAARRELGLGTAQKLILSMGAPYKYHPDGALDFVTTAQQIVAAVPSAVVRVIGPDPAEPYWQQAAQRSQGAIAALGRIPADQVGAIVAAADLAIESFPLGSPTSLLDIGKYGVPCLVLRTAMNHADFGADANVYCATPEQLVQRATDVLNGTQSAPNLLAEIAADSLPAATAEKLAHLRGLMPARHATRVPPAVGEREPSAIERHHAHHVATQQRTSHRLARWLIYRLVRHTPLFEISRRAYTLGNAYGLV